MSSREQRLLNAAVAIQLILLLYLEVVEWVNLYPWNDNRSGNSQPILDFALGFIVLVGAFATYRRRKPGIVAIIVLYVLWLGLQVISFWIPYVAGASESWRKVYEANFAQTVQWLPRMGNHFPPDANHVVLQLLLVAAIAFNVAALLRVGKKKQVVLARQPSDVFQ